jgi:catechol 2,3-dioxygenase-like lactoylglutathione lyase family enzyme
VPGAKLAGVHLRLPGWGDSGPTLEIFSYTRSEPKAPPAANREGFSHIAFEVDDVAAALQSVIAHGGSGVGKVVSRDVEGVIEVNRHAGPPERGQSFPIRSTGQASQPSRGAFVVIFFWISE